MDQRVVFLVSTILLASLSHYTGNWLGVGTVPY